LVHAATDNPRVSVVVPTYRRPQMLIEALESILAGGYGDFEVIVANDGPEEDLAPARSRLTDPRIRWITNPSRLGMLDNNLTALRAARGEFVAHLDDDDRWAPEMLATLVPILEGHPEVVIAFADHYVTDPEGAVDAPASDENSRRWGRASLAEGLHRPFAHLAVIDRSIPLQCASLFRRSALRLDEYDTRVGSQWDTWTSYTLAREGAGAWYVPRRLAYYRVHAGSDTASGVDAIALSFIYTWGHFLRESPLRASRGAVRSQLAAVQFTLAMKLLREGDRRGGRYHAARAAAVKPSRRSVSLALAAYLAPPLARRAAARW
jgi:glycosyltransferase involved in cell wall biosynthesis